MSEVAKSETKQEIKDDSPKEEIKRFNSIVSVKSDKPKYDFSGMFPEGVSSEESISTELESPKVRKSKNQDYILPTGLLGKTISSLFSMLGSRYPDLSEQLKLSETEEELIDAAVKPLIDDFLVKSKTKASQLSIILALVAIIPPRQAFSLAQFLILYHE